jgi:hypothetical protein
MFLKVLIPVICVLLGFSIYNISIKIIIPMLSYIKECRIFLRRLRENKTLFLKRVEDKAYIEYGIEKVFIYNVKKNIFLLLDKNNDIRMLSKRKKFFFILNMIIIKKFLKKYKSEIDNCVEYKGSLLDRRTHELMQFMIKITLDSLKDKKNKNKPENSITKPIDLDKNINLNIDDILDKINKIGYLNLTDKEKEFLNNYN